ncbi:aliphatic sulfonate ABC transporter permease SsuC [Rhodocyclus tenuis]|uniref:ABC-type nitrate/sulfonate/bicarbonate transport system permease component n=1 Tax=Rhodocyclus tenuis TaxID=1066 RepID=A0A840G2K7_RHOTE|nr:aliphatic sulfonate ABC transporter permease SsuC [Rhodocyclus tenuis]MBB4248627.1 ABC-type nitrate/sulfonate/bicarbonate transport system permease component [Rhodocyclus tenuis]
MKKTSSILLEKLVPWCLPVVLILGWQAGASLGWISSRVLPAPLDVGSAFVRLSASGELLDHLKISCGRAFAGFAVGALVGLLLGFWTGTSRLMEQLLDTSVQMVRNVPHLALTPLVILWFGIGEEAKLFLIALGVMFPVYLNTFHGIRSVDRQLIEMGRAYGLSRWQLFREVILPGALPSILVGVRFALGVMWLTLIVAETIAASSGIGYMAMNAREFFQTDVVVLAILLYAILGKLADVAAKGLERRWLRWNPNFQRAGA